MHEARGIVSRQNFCEILLFRQYEENRITEKAKRAEK